MELLVLFASALVIAALSQQIALRTVNHVGYNVLWSLPLFVALLGLGVVRIVRGGARVRWGLLMVVCGALVTGGVLCLYFLNVLVPYEVWLERGMPDRPF